MPEKAATISNAPPETASWTRFLPEVFGIQEKVRESPFRWCAREVGKHPGSLSHLIPVTTYHELCRACLD